MIMQMARHCECECECECEWVCVCLERQRDRVCVCTCLEGECFERQRDCGCVCTCLERQCFERPIKPCDSLSVSESGRETPRNVNGVGGNNPVIDEFQPHPVQEQLPGIDYCVTRSPPWREAIPLGFQHYLVMLGTTVIIPTTLVPLMGGGNVEKAEVIQTSLFVSGISTLLQTWFGSRLPVEMRGSYAFLVPAISISLGTACNNNMQMNSRLKFKLSMRRIQGSLMVSAVFQTTAGFSGFWRIAVRYLSPLSASPLVTLVGLGLFQRGFPELAKCIEIGLPALILLVLLSQYLSHVTRSRKAIFDQLVVVFSVAIVWLYAEILTVAGAYNGKPSHTQTSCRTDSSGLISAAPWIRIPQPFQWGSPTVQAGDVFPFLASSLVALIETTGTFIAASRFGGATPVPPSVLSRGAGWQGISLLLDGMFGTGTGSTASVESAGLLGLTRVGSRRVSEISAGFMLLFSVFGKFGALVASIPLPIVAAIQCIAFAYVSSAGLDFLQFCNLNSFRTKFILGFSLFMGLSVPQYFNEQAIISCQCPDYTYTGSTWFNNVLQVIFTSSATVGAFVAVFLDCTLNRGHSSTRRDNGRLWWEKFMKFNLDSRSEWFYSLPFNLNKFFRSV